MQVDRGNRLDYGFALVYGALLFAAAGAFLPTGSTLARIARGFALLAVAADGCENTCLAAITARLGADYTGPLSLLIVATWLKWLSIAACLALMSPALRACGRWGAVVGACAAASLPVAVGAAFVRGVVAEIMLLLCAFGFVGIWMQAWLSRRKST